MYGCFARGDQNNLINNNHQRALRAAFDDHTSNFTQLLEKKREFTIHQRNIYIYICIYIYIYMNIFINIQLQQKKVQSPDMIYLVCPGVKLKKKDIR